MKVYVITGTRTNRVFAVCSTVELANAYTSNWDKEFVGDYEELEVTETDFIQA